MNPATPHLHVSSLLLHSEDGELTHQIVTHGIYRIDDPTAMAHWRGIVAGIIDGPTDYRISHQAFLRLGQAEYMEQSALVYRPAPNVDAGDETPLAEVILHFCHEDPCATLVDWPRPLPHRLCPECGSEYRSIHETATVEGEFTWTVGRYDTLHLVLSGVDKITREAGRRWTYGCCETPVTDPGMIAALNDRTLIAS